jgi:hypothetical protein
MKPGVADPGTITWLEQLHTGTSQKLWERQQPQSSSPRWRQWTQTRHDAGDRKQSKQYKEREVIVHCKAPTISKNKANEEKKMESSVEMERRTYANLFSFFFVYKIFINTCQKFLLIWSLECILQLPKSVIFFRIQYYIT